MQKLSSNDDAISLQLKEAQSNNEILRYVGSIAPGKKPKVELRSFPQNHPFSRIKATDNIVAFKTKRYFEQPLIVQGPGAGPDVTAAGVFADLLKLVRYLGAHL